MRTCPRHTAAAFRRAPAGRRHPRAASPHRLGPTLRVRPAYEQLFEEKTELFAELLEGGPVTWDGKMRAPLFDQDVVAHLESGPFPTWLGVGGSPEYVV